MDDCYMKLQHSHDDQVIGVRELAILLHTSEKNVYKLHSVDPCQLPPRLNGFGRKLAWRLGTCREWVRSLGVSVKVKQGGEPQDGLVRMGRPRSPAGHVR